MNAVFQAPNMQLAWSSSFDIDYDFKRIFRVSLLIFLVLGIAIPLIPVPEIERTEQETLPPQLAKVVLENQVLPEPEKPKPKLDVKREAKPKPAPKTQAKPKPVAAQPEKQAREVAAASGLLQFQDDLMAMRDNLDLAQLTHNNLSRGNAQAKQADRSVITSQASGASGGINTASLSSDTGGSALSGRETTRVASALTSAGKSGKSVARSNRGEPGRSDEAIRKVMDSHKGAIFAIYNRALRSDPGLEGKVTVKLVIEPSGAVSSATLVGSGLNAPALEKKLLARIRLINFGAAPVARTTLNYSFDFLPY